MISLEFLAYLWPCAEELELELVTVRDWLRYAVSRFGAAGLVYGHGTSKRSTRPHISFCIPCTCRSTSSSPGSTPACCRQERHALHQTIEARIATRKPAAYLTKEAWIQGHSFYVDERVIVPRSYIGELLCKHMAEPADEWPLGLDPLPVGSVLDLCTGSGCLAILAALAFPNATVDASDICRRRACRRRAQCARLWPGGAHLAVALRSLRRPCRQALRPHHRQSALCRRGGAGGLSPRIRGRAEDRP